MQPQNADGPALLLSDIMHTMSPSPAPQLALPMDVVQIPAALTDGIAGVTAGPLHAAQLAEPLEQSDVEGMRARLLQLGAVGPNVVNGSLSATERELVDMVMRLTSNTLLHPSPTQLAAQAETIAELTAQRNVLLREKRELKANFEAEREGWDRTAEALLVKRRVAQDSMERDYETERQLARLQDDNRALKYKLSEAHSRISALETELTRLRPLLVVQPTLFRDPALLRLPGLLQAPELKPEVKKAKRKTKKEKEKEKEREAEALVRAQAAATAHSQQTAGPSKDASGDYPMDVVPETTDDDIQEGPVEGSSRDVAAGPSRSKQALVLSEKVEVADAPVEKKAKTKKRKTRTRTGAERGVPLLTDARAECLLLAARKIGRMRSGIVANMQKQHDAQAQRDRDSALDHDRTPTRRAELGRARYDGQNNPAEGLAEAGPSGLHASGGGSPAAGPSGAHGSGSGDVAGAVLGPEHSAQFPSHFHPHPAHRAYVQHPSQPPGQQHPMPQGILYMPVAHGTGVIPGSSAMPMFVPISAAWPMPTTPSAGSQTRTPIRNAGIAGPSTPMDSLLSAAQSMRDSPESGERQDSDARRRSVTAEAPESPVPKRRRTATAVGASSTGAPARGKARTARRRGRPATSRARATRATVSDSKQTTTARDAESSVQATLIAPPVARVPSALDVLADQAAQAQERGPSAGPGSGRHSPEPEKKLPALDAILRAAEPTVHLTVPIPASAKGKERAHDVQLLDSTAVAVSITPSTSEVAASGEDITSSAHVPFAPVLPAPPPTPPPLPHATTPPEECSTATEQPKDQTISQSIVHDQEESLGPALPSSSCLIAEAAASETVAAVSQIPAPAEGSEPQSNSADAMLSDEDMDAIASPRSDHTT